MGEHDERLFLALGRLEGKVDSILALSAKMEAELESQELRIRSLENNKHFALGLAACIGAAVSAATAWVVRALSS
jgi:hypothetical protein